MRTKTILAAFLFFLVHPSVDAAVYSVGGNFIQRDSAGSVSYQGNNAISGTYNDITGAIHMDVDNLWTYYETSINGEIITAQGSYSWDACLNDGSSDCTSPSTITADIGNGQWGMHALYNWYTSTNIDLVNVWDITVAPNGIISLMAIDSDGDGIPGVPEVDGPFKGYSLALDLTFTPVPVPAALWLFVSGFVGLLSLLSFKKR